MNWAELCADKNLSDLPYKIELNRYGQIIMSPTRFMHGYYQTEIAWLLKQLLSHGYVVTECAVDTPEGTKVADVTWSTPDRFRVNKEALSCSVAPEVCVEVMSPGNDWEQMRTKRDLYFNQGAIEYWLCDELGNLRFFAASGELAHSQVCPNFPTKIGE